jgi:hypothetical protein
VLLLFSNFSSILCNPIWVANRHGMASRSRSAQHAVVRALPRWEAAPRERKQ